MANNKYIPTAYSVADKISDDTIYKSLKEEIGFLETKVKNQEKILGEDEDRIINLVLGLRDKGGYIGDKAIQDLFQIDFSCPVEEETLKTLGILEFLRQIGGYDPVKDTKKIVNSSRRRVASCL